MSNRVCLLSKREVGRLDHYGLEPNHSEHLHVTVKEAMQLITNDTHRATGNTAQLRAVCEQGSNNRRWCGRPSSGYRVMQLVPV